MQTFDAVQAIRPVADMLEGTLYVRALRSKLEAITAERDDLRIKLDAAYAELHELRVRLGLLEKTGEVQP